MLKKQFWVVWDVPSIFSAVNMQELFSGKEFRCLYCKEHIRHTKRFRFLYRILYQGSGDMDVKILPVCLKCIPVSKETPLLGNACDMDKVCTAIHLSAQNFHHRLCKKEEEAEEFMKKTLDHLNGKANTLVKLRDHLCDMCYMECEASKQDLTIPILRCAKCHMIYYCSQECARAHAEEHVKECPGSLPKECFLLDFVKKQRGVLGNAKTENY